MSAIPDPELDDLTAYDERRRTRFSLEPPPNDTDSHDAEKSTRLFPPATESYRDGSLKDVGEKPRPLSLSTAVYPEGGLEAWRVVLGGFLITTVSFGSVNSFSVFQTYYEVHQLSTSTPSEIAWIGSLQIWGIWAFGIAAGILMDRQGARVPVLLGAIFFFGGVFATSFCKVYWQFILAQGVCTCFGLGMWLVPAVTAPAHYFKKRRPIALGLVVSGSSIGGVVWPIALNQLLMHRRLSFGWSVRIVGFAQLGVLMLGAACIKTRFRHTMKQRPPLGAALADPRFFATSLANLVLNFGLYMPFLFIGDYSIYRGLDLRMAFYMAAIMNGASFFGRGLAGFAAGLAGLYNVLVLACLACTGLSFAWTSCTTQSEIIVFSCLYGFFSGFCLSLLAPAVLTLCPQPDRFGGAYVGLSALFGSFGALASGPVGGKFITNAQRSDPANLFRTLGWFQGSLFAGAAVIYAIARLLISRDKLLV